MIRGLEFANDSRYSWLEGSHFKDFDAKVQNFPYLELGLINVKIYKINI